MRGDPRTPFSIDRLTSLLSRFISRRAVAGSFAVLTFPRLADGKNKRRRRKNKRRKKKQKVTLNEFGCVNVGNFCQNSEQCCSGSCAGKKGKQTCQPHDQSTCQAGQDDYCSGGTPVLCDTSGGYSGACVSTTGNASYCQYTAYCHACSKDADCVPFCGARAACIVADECCPATGTACAVVEMFGCTFP